MTEAVSAAFRAIRRMPGRGVRSGWKGFTAESTNLEDDVTLLHGTDIANVEGIARFGLLPGGGSVTNRVAVHWIEHATGGAQPGIAFRFHSLGFDEGWERCGTRVLFYTAAAKVSSLPKRYLQSTCWRSSPGTMKGPIVERTWQCMMARP